MSDLLKRRGTFEIPRDLIYSNPEGVMAALKDVLIVHIDDNCIKNSINYYGFSRQFDLVEPDVMSPKYIAEIYADEDHEVDKVTWHRQKEYSEQDVKSMLKEIKESFAERHKE